MPRKEKPTYRDLADFCETNIHLREKSIAAQLEMNPPRFSKVKSGKYRLTLSDAEVAAIAAILNQSETYVRDYYSARSE